MEVPAFHLWFYAKVSAGILALSVIYGLIRRIIAKERIRRLTNEQGCRSVKVLPTRDPILGLDLFYTLLQELKNHTSLEGSRSRYRQLSASTISFPILGRPVIATCEPENIKTVLATKFEDYVLEPLRRSALPFVGSGIFTTDGPAWQHSRNLLKPMFTRSMLADVSVFENHVQRLISHIPHNGGTVDLQPLFFHLSLDISSHVMLGESTDLQLDKPDSSNSNPSAEFAQAFQRCLSYLSTSSEADLLTSLLPTKKNRQFKQDCKFVNNYIDKYIQKALDETTDPSFSPKSPGNDPNRSILLYNLVSQQVPQQQIRSEILNTILAGRDTTASLLSDLWFELSKHPATFRAVHSEVHSTCPPGTELSFELLKSMPYLRALLNECLRIHPVVPENVRIATRHTTLPLGGGPNGQSPVFVPRGSLVLWSVYCMHRRDALWERPDDFIPERWLDTEDRKGVRPGWAFLPFNGGPRVCIGQQFALSLVSYVTVRMLQGIREGGLESRDPDGWKENLTITCTGLGGCKVALYGREEAEEKMEKA